MGQQVRIKLKNTSDENCEAVNSELKKRGIVRNSFMSEANTIDWLEDINTNPKSHQRHLKPEGRNLQLDELKKMFSTWTEAGAWEFDVGFSRTSERQLQKIVKFICDRKDDILHVDRSESIIEKIEKITPKQTEILKSLSVPEFKPEKLPLKEQSNNKDLQSGLLLCKSFSPNPFWVIFGNVKSPSFLKERIYKEAIYNNIYRDKKRLAYLLIPQMTIGNDKCFGGQDSYDFFHDCHSMGLREHPNFFFSFVYGLPMQTFNDKVKAEKAKEFKELYTKEELTERLGLLYNKAEQMMKYRFYFEKSKLQFVYNGDFHHDEAIIQMLNTILLALEVKNEQEYNQCMTKALSRKDFAIA